MVDGRLIDGSPPMRSMARPMGSTERVRVSWTRLSYQNEVRLIAILVKIMADEESVATEFHDDDNENVHEMDNSEPMENEDDDNSRDRDVKVNRFSGHGGPGGPNMGPGLLGPGGFGPGMPGPWGPGGPGGPGPWDRGFGPRGPRPR